MENEFEKNFNVKDHQILVTKDKKEDDTPQLVVTSYIGGYRVGIALNYGDEELRDSDFESYSSDLALVHFRQIEKIFSNMQNDGN